MKYYTLIISVLLLISCKKEATVHTNKDYFYPVYNLIEKDLKNNLGKNSVQKSVSINGKMNTLQIADSAALNDLQLFRQININNPGQAGMYNGDTTYNIAGDLEKIKYQANNPESRIREMVIYFNRGIPGLVRAVEKSKSLINYSFQEFEYEFGVGYKINTTQKLIRKDTLHVDIRTTFIPSHNSK
jgi:hypothetical protein